MKFGIQSGALWGLDTVLLSMAMAMIACDAIGCSFALVAITVAFVHDTVCAICLLIYMVCKHRLSDTLKALRTQTGIIIAIGAMLGGPIGMTGYVIAVNNIGAGYTAIISSLYPAFGTLLAYIFLKEKMSKCQLVSLGMALIAIMTMSWFSTTSSLPGNIFYGSLGAILTVVGWGSEAVLCDWGMRAGDVDNEIALHIRETVSSFLYASIILPLIGGWNHAAKLLVDAPTALIALAALAGSISYLSYYKSIEVIGAAAAMALNITYSAWSVFFGFILQNNVPSILTIICCAIVLFGSIFASQDWKKFRFLRLLG